MARYHKFQDGELLNVEVVDDQQKLENVTQIFFDTFKPNELLWLDEWSDKYRVLPKSVSHEHGQWRTKRFPFTRRIMRCASMQSRAKTVVWMGGAQISKTEVLINKILQTAHQNPGPSIYVQQTIDAAKEFVMQKLQPSIDVCDAVADTLGSAKARKFADQRLVKTYPGGFISLGGANSTSFLRSKSLRDALIDECDDFKLGIGNQGNPIALLLKRLANFPLSKALLFSTPGIDEISIIKPAYEEGSQESFYVPCPHCNPKANIKDTMIFIKWNLIKYGDDLDDDGLPKDIYLECPECKKKIYETDHKTWMLEHGEWLTNYGIEEAPLEKVTADLEHVSFKINSFYSPLGFFSWRDAVKEWFDYIKTKSPEKLQVIVNATWGETWSDNPRDVAATWVAKRVEPYIIKQTGEDCDVPMNGLCVVAGADIQDDRIEAEAVAFGPDKENWSVEYCVFYGPTISIESINDPESVWAQLDAWLLKKYKHESGKLLNIECVLIDSGHRSEEVNVFCRTRENRRIFPCKGFGGWYPVRVKRPKHRTERYKTWLMNVYVDQIKEELYSLLKIEEPGPGFCHFPTKNEYNSTYFDGLTSERRVIKVVSGVKKLVWERTSDNVRNEPLDCRVYAMAAEKIHVVNYELRQQQIHDFINGVQLKVRPIHKMQRRMIHKGFSV